MDFKAVIELVKYTLALTAACFVYSLEKLAPHSTPGGPSFVFGLLAAFAFAACVGVFIFSSATAGLHAEQENDANRVKRQKARISIAGPLHVIVLLLGMIALSGMLGYRLFTDAPKPAPFCCEPGASPTAK